MQPNRSMTTQEKLQLYMELFSGRTDVYGTYDVKTGRTRQVKGAHLDTATDW